MTTMTPTYLQTHDYDDCDLLERVTLLRLRHRPQRIRNRFWFTQATPARSQGLLLSINAIGVRLVIRTKVIFHH